MIRIDPVSIARLGRVVLSGFFALLLPSAAQAACEQWDVSGKWTIAQSNINGPVFFTLEQNGTELRGNAAYRSVLSKEWGETTVPGSVVGTVKGNKFRVNIVWSFPSYSPVRRDKGVYNGTIGQQGRLKGTGISAYAIDPRLHATFYSNKYFSCAAVTGTTSAPLVSGPPPRALGRVKAEPGTPAAAPVSICDSARRARARNSPAAPGLERQCSAHLAYLATSVASATVEPPVYEGPPLDRPVHALGRVKAEPGMPEAAPVSICESAKSARARNSPAAPGLERRCDAYLATEAAGLSDVPNSEARVERRPNSPPGASVRHMRPEIYVQGQGSVRLDWCREWASNCGPPAAEAFCRELSPDQPYASDFEMAKDIGRTAIISSHQICTDPSCDGFVHITCLREPVQVSPVR